MKRTMVIAAFILIFVLVGSAAAAQGYTHPSGMFSMVEFGALTEETDDGALFENENGSVMVLFGEAPIELTKDTLPSVVRPVIEGAQSIENFKLQDDKVETLANGFSIPFEFTLAGGDTGQGSAFVTQADSTLYVMLLLTTDLKAVADDWAATVDSFTPGPELAPAGQPAPETPAAKPKPKPTATPTPQPTVPPAEIPAADNGQVSSGFEPKTDGFGFYNYGNDIPATNLTPAEVHRMFGDKVCASLAGGKCTLSPTAQQWMEQINSYMSGGHCEGMAVLSALMYYSQIKPDDFGGKTPFDLKIEDNKPLQEEIAYWWTTQATYPGSTIRVSDSPSAVLDTLIENFANGKKASEWWVMGFYKPDGSAGHAVTPIGVEDKGNGLYNILIYDNNFPGETRVVEVDRNKDTWQYEGSPNPEVESFLYTGNAELKNLELVALTPRLKTQDCDFCAGASTGQGSSKGSKGALRQAAPATQSEADNPIWADMLKRWALLTRGEAEDFYQIWLVGKSDLYVVDDWGRGIGYSKGEIVNDIPGASTVNMRIFSRPAEGSEEKSGLDKDKSPVYRIPVGLSFDIVVDGTPLKEASGSDVTMLGPGYYLQVSNVWLEPGETDNITVYIDKNRHQLTYNTSYSESPDIEMGLETDEADYALQVKATELVGAEDNFDIGLDLDTNEFLINTSYNTDPSTYDVYVLRVDDEGERVFGATDIVMNPENTAFIPFTQWEGEGKGLQLDLDHENDGKVDKTIELPDVTGQFDFYGEEDTTE